MPNKPKEFKIGLAMSGAISAGAYSAGVYDFLIEALEEWEKVRNDPNVPEHRVILAAMAGASAGSITSTVGTLAACRGAIPTGDPTIQITDGGAAYRVLPDLYTAWVARPDFLTPIITPAEVTIGSLLSVEDLDKKKGEDLNKKVFSLLNAYPLRYIGDEAFSTIGAATRSARPYFPQKLHTYLTLTNLRGIPYDIVFSAEDGGASQYGMMCHRDWVHYRLDNIGTANFEGKWAKDDRALNSGGKCLDITTLPAANPITDTNWSAYIENTIASGAFPVGLRARLLVNPLPVYDGRYWPLPFELKYMDNFRPRWPEQWAKTPSPSIPFEFASVDGGVIDNDPFQFARYALMENPPKQLERDTDKADRAVIMITPFPELPEVNLHYKFDEAGGLLAVIKQLVPMLIQQNRFKPEEVFSALNPEHASRWMISPLRYDQNDPKNKPETFGIACGLLGGFGGFLDRQFREHDYELGRKNCQDFLARWLGLPADNTNIDAKAALPQAPGIRVGEPLRNPPPQFPIIPLCGRAAIPVQVRPWPQVPKQRVDALTKQAMIRLNRVKDVLTEDLGVIAKTALGLAWTFKLESQLEKWVRYSVLGDLVRRDQLADEQIIGLTSDDRRVLQACIDPTYDYRSAQGISKQFDNKQFDNMLTEPQVEQILVTLKAKNLVDTFWRGINDKGKLVGIAGSLFDSGSKPIYTYIDRQQPIIGIPGDPTFD